MSDNVPEEFEQFALAHGLGLDRMDGFYSDDDTHLAWTAWVASTSKDAKRYRWLSYNASYGIHEMLFGKPAFASTHKESDLAECIDEQIAAEEKND